MKNMLKLGCVLALYSAVACVLLALVDGQTAPRIAAGRENEVLASLSVVYADADDFVPAPDFTPVTRNKVTIENLYLAKKQGALVGAVAQASGPTYDRATLLLGVTLDRHLTSVKIMSISDTPGYGQRATESAFHEQFAGKTDQVEDVQALSGATITTKGITAILQNAAQAAGDYLATAQGREKL